MDLHFPSRAGLPMGPPALCLLPVPSTCPLPHSASLHPLLSPCASLTCLSAGLGPGTRSPVFPYDSASTLYSAFVTQQGWPKGQGVIQVLMAPSLIPPPYKYRLVVLLPYSMHCYCKGSYSYSWRFSGLEVIPVNISLIQNHPCTWCFKVGPSP